ncbi:hypothetical protein EJ06DRAFT_579420 [Trichodelitschia bisporula]|uniref:Uncharacterized protein n=1 Tax=Trichodelitschia bisporula TaxID=703511 RepID=A0A6G1I591_9PEZI|nr:hypothetical protein EJ06DRAFT_579420 [Trichodelitschia bisporula]
MYHPSYASTEDPHSYPICSLLRCPFITVPHYHHHTLHSPADPSVPAIKIYDPSNVELRPRRLTDTTISEYLPSIPLTIPHPPTRGRKQSTQGSTRSRKKSKSEGIKKRTKRVSSSPSRKTAPEPLTPPIDGPASLTSTLTNGTIVGNTNVTHYPSDPDRIRKVRRKEYYGQVALAGHGGKKKKGSRSRSHSRHKSHRRHYHPPSHIQRVLAFGREIAGLPPQSRKKKHARKKPVRQRIKARIAGTHAKGQMSGENTLQVPARRSRRHRGEDWSRRSRELERGWELERGRMRLRELGWQGEMGVEGDWRGVGSRTMLDEERRKYRAGERRSSAAKAAAERHRSGSSPRRSNPSRRTSSSLHRHKYHEPLEQEVDEYGDPLRQKLDEEAMRRKEALNEAMWNYHPGEVGMARAREIEEYFKSLSSDRSLHRHHSDSSWHKSGSRHKSHSSHRTSDSSHRHKHHDPPKQKSDEHGEPLKQKSDKDDDLQKEKSDEHDDPQEQKLHKDDDPPKQEADEHHDPPKHKSDKHDDPTKEKPCKDDYSPKQKPHGNEDPPKHKSDKHHHSLKKKPHKHHDSHKHHNPPKQKPHKHKPHHYHHHHHHSRPYTPPLHPNPHHVATPSRSTIVTRDTSYSGSSSGDHSISSRSSSVVSVYAPSIAEEDRLTDALADEAPIARLTPTITQPMTTAQPMTTMPPTPLPTHHRESSTISPTNTPSTTPFYPQPSTPLYPPTTTPPTSSPVRAHIPPSGLCYPRPPGSSPVSMLGDTKRLSKRIARRAGERRERVAHLGVWARVALEDFLWGKERTRGGHPADRRRERWSVVAERGGEDEAEGGGEGVGELEGESFAELEGGEGGMGMKVDGGRMERRWVEVAGL